MKLAKCKLTYEDSTELFEAIGRGAFSCLEELDLSENNRFLGTYLATAIKAGGLPHLKKLNLTSTGILETVMLGLFKALREYNGCLRLEWLCLSHNHINASMVAMLKAGLDERRGGGKVKVDQAGLVVGYDTPRLGVGGV